MFKLALAQIIIFFCSAHGLASNTLTLDRALIEAVDSNMANSPAWLKLLRYRRNSLSNTYTSEVDDPKYFVAPDGKHNPVAELKATIVAFLSDSALRNDAMIAKDEATNPQCRYLARQRLLWREIKALQTVPQATCEKARSWIRELNAEAVSLIFASAYMGNPASMFGHTFLKFHTRGNDENKDLLNYGINFAAVAGASDGALYIWNGLTGGFQGRYSLLPYHQALTQYAHLEGRDIWEYRLNLSPSEVESFIEQLLELEQSYFDYYFLDENCSYHILSALDAVRPALRLVGDHEWSLIPADAVRRLVDSPGLITERNYRPSLRTQFYQSANTLDAQQTDYLNQLIHTRKVPVQTNLSSSQQAQALNTALIYGATQEPHDPQAWTKDLHQWKIARARLGQTTSTLPAPEPQSAPERGHRSKSIRAGGGSFRGVLFSEIEAMPAYHSWLASDVGFLPHSQIEVLRTKFRHYSSTTPRLEEFKILDIIATGTLDRYFKTISWRADVGFERPTDDLGDKAPEASIFESPLLPSLRGGIGLNTALSKHRVLPLITVFAMAHGQTGNYLKHGDRVGFGPQTALTWKLSDTYKFQILWDQMWYIQGQISELNRWQLASRWNFKQNWDVQVTGAWQNGMAASSTIGYYF